MNKLTRNFWILKTRLLGLKKVGKRSCIFKPLQIDYPNTISIGKRVFVGHYAWLIGSNNANNEGLIIGNRCTLGHFSHIVASKEVVIENDVLLADKVFISDCNHEYKDLDTPIQNQGIHFVKPVRIGEGSWVGDNVCVCGASIGKHCVIGANSVVINDIPDYSVAVGNPAKVIKILK